MLSFPAKPPFVMGALRGGERMEGEYLTIPLDLKMRCVELFESGLTARQVYNDVFAKEHEGMSFESFRRKLRAWKSVLQSMFAAFHACDKASLSFHIVKY